MYLSTTAEKQGQISALCTCVSYCLLFALQIQTLQRSNMKKKRLLSRLCCNQQVWGIWNLWGWWGEKRMFLFLSIPCWGMPERPFQKCNQVKVDYKFFWKLWIQHSKAELETAVLSNYFWNVSTKKSVAFLFGKFQRDFIIDIVVAIMWTI